MFCLKTSMSFKFFFNVNFNITSKSTSISLQSQLQCHFKQDSIYFELLFCDLVIDHLSLVKMKNLIAKDTDILTAVASDND